MKYITEDTNGKHTNIKTIYNQYLIRNDLQKEIKNAKQRGLGLVGQESTDQEVWSKKVWK